MRPVVVALVVALAPLAAACATARPVGYVVARFEPADQRMTRLPSPPPGEAPPRWRGELDADGRLDGEWDFDCDDRHLACHAWYEHGVQHRWAFHLGRDRWLIETTDDGWRWQRWNGDQLLAQAHLAFAPTPWQRDYEASFARELSPPWERGCAGAFWSRRPDGSTELEGRCAGARWVEWQIHDPRGRVLEVRTAEPSVPSPPKRARPRARVPIKRASP